MEKVKLNLIPKILNIIKCALFAVVITLIGTIFLAVALKFLDLSSNVIGWVNNVIKIMSLFFMVILINKTNEGRVIFKTVLGGMIYSLFCFLIFSILNGNVSFNFSFIYDLLFSAVVSIVATIILNITGKKTV